MIYIFSPAKINLTLDVFPKHPESSFHPIATIYHLLDWGDEIFLTPHKTFSIEGNFPFPREENLIYKSWKLLQEHFTSLPPVKVRVKKRIPFGSGLGGGSSNAASFALAYLFWQNLPLSPELITHFGVLGKDIPFFLLQTPCALGTHYGEIITPILSPFKGKAIFLHFPHQKKESTKKAYQNLKPQKSTFTERFLFKPSASHLQNAFASLYNIPGKGWHLTGSGGCFFRFTPSPLATVKTTLAKSPYAPLRRSR